MDLPKETPAGDHSSPVLTGDWSAARDFSPAEPAGLADGVDSGARRPGWLKYLSTPRRKRSERAVLDVHTNATTSPTAPGQKNMHKRTKIASAAIITGAGVLWLGLAACGQKPAPAEEAAST